jgi:hypothetical protein
LLSLMQTAVLVLLIASLGSLYYLLNVLPREREQNRGPEVRERPEPAVSDGKGSVGHLQERAPPEEEEARSA